MPSQSFDAAFKALRKGEVPPALYLYGPEEVLKEEAIRELIDRTLDPSLRDFNLDQRSAVTLDPDDVEALCTTLPMLAARRVVIIRDVEAWSRRAKAKTQVLRYLDRPVPETVMVLVQGSADPDPDTDLVKRTTAVAVEPLPPDRAQKWLQLQAERLGIQLDDEAAEHLVRVTEANLSIIRTELAKFEGLTGRITRERASELLGVRHGETQYDWLAAVLRDEPGRAALILPHVLSQSGVTGVSLVMLLGTNLVGLGLARAHYDHGARGGALIGAVKNSLFRARPARLSYDAAAAEWSRLAPRWPAARVAAAIRAALAADERLKSTTLGDDLAILTELVMQLTMPWSKAA
jgi:DNA polymerase-3 subunit delta